MDSCSRSFSRKPSFSVLLYGLPVKNTRIFDKETFLLIQIYICIFYDIIIFTINVLISGYLLFFIRLHYLTFSLLTCFFSAPRRVTFRTL